MTKHDIELPEHWQAFQYNEGWGSWEQVIPSAANKPGVVKAYTADQVVAAIEAVRKQRGEPDYFTYVINGHHRGISETIPPDDAYDAGTLVPLYSAPQPAAPAKVPVVWSANTNVNPRPTYQRPPPPPPPPPFQPMAREYVERFGGLVRKDSAPQPAESHVERARRIVDSWPEWKRNYALTKHDVKPTQPAEPVKVPSDDLETLRMMRAEYDPGNGPMSALKAAALDAAIAALLARYGSKT